MKYITGFVALAVPCKLDTVGKWNVTKKEFMDEENMKLRESDDSPFKDWGIEENKMINYHEFCTFNVANHVRAYLDMLVDMRFDELEGVFEEYLKSLEARKDIFMMVVGKLRDTTNYPLISQFMTHEFGSSWYSYLDAITSVSSHIARADEERKELLLRQAADEVLSKVDEDAEHDSDKKGSDITRRPEYS